MKKANKISNEPIAEPKGQHAGSKLDSSLLILAITSLSFLTRMYSIDKPSHVCWDETHFGKMASWYINRTFFFDVHPPLGKMVIALAGFTTGYDGRFAFEKPGDEYDHLSQYLGMRIFCALMGLSIPVMMYQATRNMTGSHQSGLIASLLAVFDNGLITLTRYILLDPPLLFFITSAILGMSELSFNDQVSKRPFSKRWWFWLFWNGAAIACAFSVKFVGLFIVATVGLRTAYDLWILLGDYNQSICYFLKHLFARILCLIVLPILLYTSFFYIHLKTLNRTGNGDGFYSSSFQSQLIGNSLHNSSWPAHLAYGAEVTIKNNRIGGAYLHSHWHLYPEGVGAKQQQVTTYSHKDSNNRWIVKHGVESQRPDDIFVRDGDLIRLEHIMTKRNLHSHFELAPITKRHFQVTCYGENGTGDANDIWRIQKEVSSRVSGNDDRIFTVRTRFRLIHLLTNCALHSHSKQLPKWGYEQMEVTCNPKLFDRNNYWNIEDNQYSSLPNVSFEHYAPSFIEMFIESHAVMLQGNAGLKPKEGEVTSRPWQWPLNYKGQFFSASKGQKIYLLGNPIIWWANIAFLPLSLVLLLILSVKRKARETHMARCQDGHKPRGKLDGIEYSYLESAGWMLLGWCLHYIPFFFMGRVLYFHHYFPAFIFSCMLTATTYDFLLTMTLRRLFKQRLDHGILERRKTELLLVPMSVIIYTFIKFVPITYGIQQQIGLGNYTTGSNESTVELSNLKSEQQLSSLKWLDSWEF